MMHTGPVHYVQMKKPSCCHSWHAQRYGAHILWLIHDARTWVVSDLWDDIATENLKQTRQSGALSGSSQTHTTSRSCQYVLIKIYYVCRHHTLVNILHWVHYIQRVGQEVYTGWGKANVCSCLKCNKSHSAWDLLYIDLQIAMCMENFPVLYFPSKSMSQSAHYGNQSTHCHFT